MLPRVTNDVGTFQRLTRAWTLLLTNPFIPLIYYGDELALAGGLDPDCRRPMPWEDALARLGEIGAEEWAAPSQLQRQFQADIQALGAVRQEHPALYAGQRRFLLREQALLVYEMSAGEDRLLIALSQSAERTERSLSGLLELPEAGETPLLFGEGTLQRGEGEQLSLQLPAGAAAIFHLRTLGRP